MTKWTPRYYYIMLNKTSGMKYLGQTVQDIERYRGSGTYWKPHCKKYGGYDRENIEVLESLWIEKETIASQWLYDFEMKNKEYWLSEDWANQVPENTEENPFYGSGVNNSKVRNGTHPFQKHNVTEKMKLATKITQFGSPKHKKVLLNKYGVVNAMKDPEIAKRAGKTLSKTIKKNGGYHGAKNSNARPLTVNGISFSYMNEACEYFGISMYYMRKAYKKCSFIELDIKELDQRKKRYGPTNH